MRYWLNLFSGATWKEFDSRGGDTTGFRETRWRLVQRMQPGDVILCYLTGISRWIGNFEVTGQPYIDESRIWKSGVFPARVPVRVIHKLAPETAVPILELRDRLSIFKNLKNPNAWTGKLRGSPTEWSDADGQIICDAIRSAATNPIDRPFDPAKLQRRSSYKESSGPGPRGKSQSESSEVLEAVEPGSADEISEHLRMQGLLAEFGSAMGMKIWIAANDRSRSIDGHKFSEMPSVVNKLPVQFDADTKRTIELIDCLWIKGREIVAAFEVESTTSIYSGLLRMADLVALLPHLSIPLYIVAPDERRERVRREINRPAFDNLKTPLVKVCQFISFGALTDLCKRLQSSAKHVKPEILSDISEPCIIADEDD